MRDVESQIKSGDYAAEGHNESSEFSISLNGKMFDLLISGIYSRPIEAVVREIAANALDAHTMAGTPERPFKVTIPTHWDSFFKVRDFGPGMSHEFVMREYSRFGFSTKDMENQSTGKFGLGCKAPFAAGDQFTVTVFQGGKARVYNAFRNEERIPKIVLFGVTDTDEADGVEVCLPVQSGDVWAFQNAAKRVFIGFDVQPEIEDATFAPRLPATLSGNGWRLFDSQKCGLRHAPHVRQGCVIYPIDMGELVRGAPVDALPAIRAFETDSVLFDMPLGTVEVNPNRETMKLTPTTLNNIVQAFRTMGAEITARIEAELAHAPNLCAALRFREKIASGLTGRGLALGSKWNGRILPDAIEVKEQRMIALRRHGVDVRVMKASQSGRVTKRVDYSGQARHMRFVPCEGRPLTFYYWPGDVSPKYLGHRVAAANARLGGQRSHTTYILPNFKRGGAQEAFLRASLGRPEEGIDIVFADLEAEAFDKPRSSGKSIGQLKYWDRRRDQWQEMNSAPMEDDDTILYVRTHSKEVVIGTQTDGSPRVISNSSFCRIVDCLVGIGAIDLNEQTIVAIPASRADLKKAPEAWEPLLDRAKEESEAFSQENLAKFKANQLLTVAEESRQTASILHIFSGYWHLIKDANSAILVLLAMREALGNALSAGTAADEKRGQLCAELGQDSSSVAGSIEPESYLKDYREACDRQRKIYPMLDLLLSARRDSYYTKPFTAKDVEALAEYVNLIDLQRECAVSTDILVDADAA